MLIWMQLKTSYLHFQDLVMDDTFVNELDERQAVTIQVVPNFGKK